MIEDAFLLRVPYRVFCPSRIALLPKDKAIWFDPSPESICKSAQERYYHPPAWADRNVSYRVDSST